MNRLAKLRDEQARITTCMKTFCLNPNKETYDKICASALARDDAHAIWKLACLYKYGNDILPCSAHEQTITAFMIREENLCARVISDPSKTRAIEVLHLYYALGELKYIELFYQLFGHEKLPRSTRAELAELYKETRDLFTRTIFELSQNPKHFADYDMRDIDFKYFDDVAARYKQSKEDSQANVQMVNSMAGNTSARTRVQTDATPNTTTTTNTTKPASPTTTADTTTRMPESIKERLQNTTMPTSIYGITKK